MKLEEYWNKFLIDNNLDINTKYFDAFMFGDEMIADELLKLVLKGKKKATTSLYYEKERYPKIGDYSIVLDSKGKPKCILKTIDYKILPFNEATYDLIKAEGEDEVLDTWTFNHKKSIINDCKELNIEYRDDIPIFFEYFDVVYII